MAQIRIVLSNEADSKRGSGNVDDNDCAGVDVDGCVCEEDCSIHCNAVTRSVCPCNRAQGWIECSGGSGRLVTEPGLGLGPGLGTGIGPGIGEGSTMGPRLSETETDSDSDSR